MGSMRKTPNAVNSRKRGRDIRRKGGREEGREGEVRKKVGRDGRKREVSRGKEGGRK